MTALLQMYQAFGNTYVHMALCSAAKTKESIVFIWRYFEPNQAWGVGNRFQWERR
jgi:hypothetical protein